MLLELCMLCSVGENMLTSDIGIGGEQKVLAREAQKPASAEDEAEVHGQLDECEEEQAGG